jgi:hypothetical protein
MWAVSGKRTGKQVATERLILGNCLRNTVSMDTETENSKHLENQTVALELIHGFRDNANRTEELYDMVTSIPAA